MIGFIIRLLIGAAGLWLASRIVPGVDFTDLPSILLAAFLLGLANAIVRPVFFILTLPLTIMTLGLFVFVLNAIMLLITSAISRAAGFDFHVDGFIAALIGALIVGITSAVLNLLIPDGDED
jgi:putative membrane protein